MERLRLVARSGSRTVVAALASFALMSVAASGQEPPPPVEVERTAPLDIRKASGPIVVDGDLGDAGWQGALSFDSFFETSPADNAPAKVKTTVRLTYDEKYFYVGVEADDPEPSKIRAPYVERDQVLGTDDNIAVFLDTRNDHRAALELRVSPRGIQADGVYQDSNGSEDFSPDFFYDTGAKITDRGWQAEYRIPFSSLRYTKEDPQSWGILVWRNYPRDFRYAFHSSPIGRGSNCLVCHSHEIRGFSGLPDTKHLVVAPYVSAALEGAPENGPGSKIEYGDPDFDGGVDVKWNPTASSAIDLTVNPDFSQIESDTAQISANQRFALFYPEKRPFFLEGVDLFDTPIQAVYTRTITDPGWGARATGKSGDFGYTLLVASDEGGGLVVLPGPQGSGFAPQEFESTAVIGRLRRDFGLSYGGLLYTGREIDGGGYNRVFGPDFQWRPTESDTITGEFLWSETEDPFLPDVSGAFQGAKTSGHGASLGWNRNKSKYDVSLRARDFDDDFRADNGFVTQVGYTSVSAQGGLRTYPEGLFRFVRYYGYGDVSEDTEGDRLQRTVGLGLFGFGTKNLNLTVEAYDQEVRVGPELLGQTALFVFLQVDPGRHWPRVGFEGQTGEQIDFANAREGDGTSLSLFAQIRPTEHFELRLDARRSWLDVAGGRLFTARVERAKGTYVFNQRITARLIGQYVRTENDPSLYTFPVDEREGGFSGSALFSYKINWQTVLFFGYGDERTLLEDARLQRASNAVFLKISYAIQR